jgi:hypothetical protein
MRSSSCISKSKFSMISSPSAFFPSSISAKLTGEFTSLEEPYDDSDIATVLDSLADGPGFAGSERRIEPKDPTRKFRLSIVRSIS